MKSMTKKALKAKVVDAMRKKKADDERLKAAKTAKKADKLLRKADEAAAPEARAEAEWQVSTALEEVLEEAAEKMKVELREAGVEVKQAKTTSKEKAQEAADLKKTELKIRAVQANAKSQVFVMDGKIKDKRDMIAKGSAEESLFDFESTGASAAEYRKEGNVEFYTQANLHKRKAIACDKVIIKWIDIFWSTFSSVHHGGNVQQAESVQVQMNIAKALFDPEDWDEEETREMVESDWVRENGLASNMEKHKFEKSLFELVDTWCSSIKLVEYRMFLQKLYFRITGASGNLANKEKYQKRLRDLERQQRKLRKNKEKYLDRIADLAGQAKAIAAEATLVRGAKLEAMTRAKLLDEAEATQRARIKVLEEIAGEGDAKLRAKLVAKNARQLEASGVDLGAGVEAVLLKEAAKLANAEAQRRAHDVERLKITEAEERLAGLEKALSEERQTAESDVALADVAMQKVTAESGQLQSSVKDLARAGRAWATLDQVKSLDGLTDDEAVRQMRADVSFLTFCKDHDVELQDEGDAQGAELGALVEEADDRPEDAPDRVDAPRPASAVSRAAESDVEAEAFLEDASVASAASVEASARDDASEQDDKLEAAATIQTANDEAAPEASDDDTSVSSDASDEAAPSRPPADFSSWHDSPRWSAWRGMHQGRPPPDVSPTAAGAPRTPPAGEAWRGSLRPLTGAPRPLTSNGRQRRMLGISGFPRRASHSAGDLPPVSASPGQRALRRCHSPGRHLEEASSLLNLTSHFPAAEALDRSPIRRPQTAPAPAPTASTRRR
ncbi:hypothetical protein M885DRAFT_626490 [Pelagophyceae sp. CCMP2097]|nr:hypothetical protein M885DRAFT_626490 [Pelagophyceae sp. CCMP2097]